MGQCKSNNLMSLKNGLFLDPCVVYWLFLAWSFWALCVCVCGGRGDAEGIQHMWEGVQGDFALRFAGKFLAARGVSVGSILEETLHNHYWGHFLPFIAIHRGRRYKHNSAQTRRKQGSGDSVWEERFTKEFYWGGCEKILHFHLVRAIPGTKRNTSQGPLGRRTRVAKMKFFIPCTN